jgi:hypothetical protein
MAEVIAAEAGHALGEGGGGENLAERVDTRVIEPAVADPHLDYVVFEGEEGQAPSVVTAAASRVAARRAASR